MILLALIGLVHSESAQYRLENGSEEVVVFHANATLHVKSEHGDDRKGYKIQLLRSGKI